MKSIRMNARYLKHLTLALALLVTAFLLNGETNVANAQNPTLPPTGMICTTNATATFNLVTQTGYIAQPDGNVVFMWGFSEAGAPFQHPSPVLCVNEGDTVTINLVNNLPNDVSIIFPGQQDVLADGVLSQPVFNAGGELVSLAPVAAANGGSVSYSFVASRPGTFIYESGTETTKQIDMGLFGVLVVRPSAVGLPAVDPNNGEAIGYVYNEAESAFKPSNEYLLLISEIDPELHMAVEQGFLYDPNRYTPRYWMYNGRGFPDTIADNGALFLPEQPYGSLVYYHPYDPNPTLDGGGANPAYNPNPALLRVVNVGKMMYTHHPHGNHGRIVGRDGHLLKSSDGWDESYEKFAVTSGPGQTLDILYRWVDVEKYNPVTNPIPVTIPQLQDLAVGQWYSGSPYLGQTDNLPVGTQAFNQCGEYYHLAHNHALHQITAWGVVLSGQITFARIDPPLPNQCP